MKRTLIILLSAVMLISCQKDGQNEQTRNDKTEQQEAKKNYKTY